jgi:ribosomal protein S18 acetylase RimI-like enzyme
MSGARAMSHADVPSVVGLHLDAFAGSMGAALGPGYARGFLDWFVDAPEAITTVVERDGQVAGYVVGAVHGYATRMNRALLPTIVRGIVANPRVLLHRNFAPQLPQRLATLASRTLGARASGANGVAVDPGVFALVGIGVSPAARGRGVGKQLLADFEARVFADPRFHTITLEVYQDNPAAIRLYEQAGWKRLTQVDRVLVYTREREPS